ncbi:mannose-6-phosphate isomerase [Gemmobacter aquarius]|uniref:Mannose-6-phosphate isomerase n=2 Tax=Paragemmobacter aquarius TaxID=2169400 RepID=A0A2S0UHC5_9RHOB|nr:mannose-6-phosphate isomerase [Gemmobacter aquarius]
MTPSQPARWIDWLCHQALPLWSDVGFDRRGGSFVERLSPQGAPLVDVPRRLMVQARQIHVFATAARNGWDKDGGSLALRAGDAMIAAYAAGSDGWVFSCSADGTVADPRRDLYAHAFVLLALAALIRLDGQVRHIRMVQTTLAFLDREMAHPAGGFAENWPNTSLPRRQNPHMHLLEALIALQETGLCGDMSDRMKAIVALFDRRFFSPDAVLTEFFDDEWSPLNPDNAFEPGHHFEWAWLLARHGAMTRSGAGNRIDRLLAKGLRGCDTKGTVTEAVSDKGTANTSRLWAAMEAAKALSPPIAAAVRAAGTEKVLDKAWQSFIAPAVAGGWVDRVDAAGNSLVDHIPASSLYHIVTAIDFLTSEDRQRARRSFAMTGLSL